MQGMQKVHEKMVRRVWGIADYLKAALVCFGAAVIIVAMILLGGWLTSYGLSMIVPIVICGAGVGAWYLIGAMRIEYEYSYFNGELDLDVIIARRKRRRVATVKVGDFERFGSYATLGMSKSEMKDSFTKRYFMCSHPSNPNCCYAIFKHEYEMVLLVFEPDEETLDEFRKVAPRLFR